MATYSPSQLGINPPAGGFQTGGWYNGRQYWNGSLSEPGQIHPSSNQAGAGQNVSQEVVNQSDPLQNQPTGTNWEYLQQQQQQAQQNQNQQGQTGQVVTTGNGMSQGTGLGVDIGSMFGTGEGGGNSSSLNLQSLYDSIMNSPEMQSLNTNLSNAQAEIDRETQAYNQAVSQVQDNPMYSASTMVGKIAKIDDKYGRNMNRLMAKKQMEQDNINKMKADAEVKMNIAMKQYDINKQEYQDRLGLFNSLLQSGAFLNASGTDIASMAIATGLPTSMIENMINKQKSDNVKPQVITSTDDNGNVTVSVIDANTGDIIGQNSLGQIDTTRNTGSGSGGGTAGERQQAIVAQAGQYLNSQKNSYGHVSPQIWDMARQAWINEGLDLEDFYKKFRHMTDPNRGDFESAYGITIDFRTSGKND